MVIRNLDIENSGHVKHQCDSDLCIVCEGGLYMCSVCGCAEGTLTSECPGDPVSTEVQDLIYNDKLNYVNGQWERLDG